MKHVISYSEYPADRVEHVRESFIRNKELLAQYVDNLLWWNERINLVSRDVPRETVLNHVEHSLSILGSELFNESDFIIDTGSGGGLPGIPLAILKPEKSFILNDIVSKKIMACKHIATKLKLNNIDSRIGSLKDLEVKPGSIMVSKHAFKINEMMEMVEGKPWLGVILLKGKEEVENELKGIKPDLDISIFDLRKSFGNPFYDGKAMVEIKRKD